MLNIVQDTTKNRGRDITRRQTHMKTDQSESVVEDNGRIIFNDSMKNLQKHRMKSSELWPAYAFSLDIDNWRQRAKQLRD